MYNMINIIIMGSPFFVTEPPSIPPDLRISTLLNGSYSATAELVFGDQSTRSMTHGLSDDTIYTINVTSSGETWTSTAAQVAGRKLISLSYNTNYSLDVMATNCAGNSEVYTITIFIGIHNTHTNHSSIKKQLKY